MNSNVRRCPICGKNFTLRADHPNQLYCSKPCAAKANAENARAKRRKLAARCYIRPTNIETPKPQGKSLADWCREADECNLDYGTYRGLIEQGHTFDELKAQNRPFQIHARRTTHHSYSTGDFI